MRVWPASIVGAINFAIYAGRSQMEKLQDSRLSVPGTRSQKGSEEDCEIIPRPA